MEELNLLMIKKCVFDGDFDVMKVSIRVHPQYKKTTVIITFNLLNVSQQKTVQPSR